MTTSSYSRQLRRRREARRKTSIEGKIMFKIETEKWSWAKAVQSKNVYRDEEFVRTKTKEEALKAIEFLMEKPRGLTYTITVHRNGEYFTYFRHSMPCLGGLVKYKDSHGKTHYMNPYFPRDIYVAFPEGDIVYIACHRPGTKDILKTPYFEFIFSDESPWVSAFGSKDKVLFKNTHFVLTDMNTDPTVFYSMMRLGGLASYGAYAQKSKCDPKAQILAFYTIQADPRRLAGQKPIRISGGTWAQGYGYTRPYNESIFKTKLPHKLKDFEKVGAYPQAPYDNKYYVSEMKSKFGLDAAGLNMPGKLTGEVEKTLIKAWDHFKEKAKELDE